MFPLGTHPYLSARRRGSRRSHHRSASPPSTEDSSEDGSDASRRGRRHYGGHHSRRDTHEGRSAAVGQEQLLSILSDIQRRLAAVERPTSPHPSSLAPQEEMEITDLPSEAADDFSSEEENGDWTTQLPAVTEATASEPPATTIPRPRVAPTVTVTSASSLGDFSHGEEPEWRMYRDIVNSVYRYNDSLSRQTASVDEMFGGDLVLLRPRVDRGDRYVSLPQSEVVTRALQHGLLRGGQAGQTPRDEDRVGEGAQRWGANMSLTHPPIRQFRPEFYRIHHADPIPEGERFYPHTPWTTTSAPLVSKRGYAGEFSVKASQLKD